MVADVVEPVHQPWFVYVLYSVSTGRTYVGITTHPARRLQQHNDGKGAKACRIGRPWSMPYAEMVGSKSLALQREAAIKKLKRRDKLILAGLAA